MALNSGKFLKEAELYPKPVEVIFHKVVNLIDKHCLLKHSNRHQKTVADMSCVTMSVTVLGHGATWPLIRTKTRTSALENVNKSNN